MPTVNWTAENDRKVRVTNIPLYGKQSQVEYPISPAFIISNNPRTTGASQLLIQLEQPTLRDRPDPLSAGPTVNSMARRILQFRGETKATNGSLTAPGKIEKTCTPSTSTAAAMRNPPPEKPPSRSSNADSTKGLEVP